MNPNDQPLYKVSTLHTKCVSVSIGHAYKFNPYKTQHSGKENLKDIHIQRN